MGTVLRSVVAASVVGGVVGGLVGAGVMSAAHALASKVTRPAESKQKADSNEKEEDATVKVADALVRRTRGRPLADDAKPVAGNVVHYGFGGTIGLLYGAVAPFAPLVTIGSGAGFGAAVWLGAHAIVVPALGLARSPLRQPASKEALEFVLHLASGVTVGVVWRAAIRIAR